MRTSVGISSGDPVRLELHPAEGGSGLHVRRADVGAQIPLHVAHATEGAYCSAVSDGRHSVFIVEHLMAALWARQITDLLVVVDRDEVPIFDGSVRPYLELLDEAGVVGLEGEVPPLALTAPIIIEDQGRLLAALPAAAFTACYYLDHPHPLIGKQHAILMPSSHCDAAAPSLPLPLSARTFVTESDARQLIDLGMLNGGSEQNAVVVYADRTSQPVPDGYFAAHKVADLLGDLYLLNRPLQAVVMACRTGHRHNQRLARRIAGVEPDTAPPS